MAISTRETFRNLVTNQSIPGFDYIETSFSFRTVYSLTQYSYRCCVCAFEHEYCDYIKEDGEIDEEMYNKIETSIVDGFCPHVDGVPEHCIKMTHIDGLIVAAAAGSLEAIHSDISSYYRGIRDRSIMGVSPFLIALLKNRTECVGVIAEDFRNRTNMEEYFASRHSEYRRKDNSKCIILKEPKSVAETCAENGITSYFKAIELCKSFEAKRHIARCFAVSIKIKNVELEKAVTACIVSSINPQNKYFNPPLMVWKQALLVTIVYDQPISLRSVLSRVSVAYRLSQSKHLLEQLAEICIVLDRKDCLSILKEFEGHYSLDISNERRAELLIYLLHGFYKDFNVEIVANLAGVMERINFSDVSLQMQKGTTAASSTLSTSLLDKRALKQLTKLGADLDFKNNGQLPLLSFVLKAGAQWGKPPLFRDIRAVVEYLISENSSIELNESALLLALKIDERYAILNTIYIGADFNGELVMDAKVHAASSKHDADSALNFFGPLLIESGFPLTKETLSNIKMLSLHTAEQEYLRECLQQPRLLSVCCRDVLRRFYTGSNLRIFIDKANVPRKIRNYIQLKEMLNCDEYYADLQIEPNTFVVKS